jgi:hypothetical protein
VCPRCRGDLRACRQCRFYDPAVADACRETEAERVADKTRANFCDYFAAADEPLRPAATVTSPRDALDRLFRRR